ncbi:MAG: hypothetical protein OEV94_10105 [Deltaproteobacteria bacterium]|nr:hypothetical protein [Deltaproteobacteria bacterium]MDH4122044.1 hypothetical protein [Deltaproteobacteria bacterium]
MKRTNMLVALLTAVLFGLTMASGAMAKKGKKAAPKKEAAPAAAPAAPAAPAK